MTGPTDHRGASVTICGADRLPARASRRVRRAHRPFGSRWRPVLSVFLATSAIAVLAHLLPLTWGGGVLRPRWPILIQPLLFTAAVSIAALVRPRGITAVFEDLAVRRSLDERVCPSCGYDLEGIAPEEDGCVVCPECGAAWRLPG